ncbi:MAG: hypothetical protein WB402_10715 [Sulfuricaulis sp.]|uniref:hypothetical protein n=1 Tax=Sulfuricaulis sp. TaxID=2003553 RepID=UPI003C3DC673
MSISPGSTLYYLILFLIFGNLFAFLIGVLMIAAPQRLGDLLKISNRWISTRRMTKPLAIPRQADRTMLRYPRALGAIMLASAALILIKGTIFISGVSVADGGSLLALLYSGVKLSAVVWEVIWVTLIMIILLGAILAIVVGLMSLFKVGKLKDWSESANRWVSTRQLTKPLDMPHYHLDKMVSAKPRLWGGVITALALFSSLVLWWFLHGA